MLPMAIGTVLEQMVFFAMVKRNSIGWGGEMNFACEKKNITILLYNVIVIYLMKLSAPIKMITNEHGNDS